MEEDFKTIYETHYAQVMRLCLGYVSGNKDRAKDLTQEVFIKVWSNLKFFRKESSMGTWIYRIAVNTCLMNLRKSKPKSFLEGDIKDTTSSEESLNERELQFLKMYRCIDTLPPTNKAIILMELEGLPQKEIASIIGLKHEAIRTRIHRIKQQLSNCVKDE